MPRLPISGQDEGEWGDLLNSFLLVEHNVDGSLKLGGSLAGKYAKPASGIPITDFSNSVQTSLSKADNAVISVSGKTGVVTITKSDIGLTNVTNDAQVKASDVDSDGNMTANTDSRVPTQRAVKAYVDNKAASTMSASDVMALAIAL